MLTGMTTNLPKENQIAQPTKKTEPLKGKTLLLIATTLAIIATAGIANILHLTLTSTPNVDFSTIAHKTVGTANNSISSSAIITIALTLLSALAALTVSFIRAKKYERTDILGTTFYTVAVTLFTLTMSGSLIGSHLSGDQAYHATVDAYSKQHIGEKAKLISEGNPYASYPKTLIYEHPTEGITKIAVTKTVDGDQTRTYFEKID